MPEIAFYHHTTRRIEETLPTLIEKSLARGWRVVVQAPTQDRVRRLDDYLWGYKPESFLPHGTKADASPETQPVYLTCEDDNPNDADVRFFLGVVAVASVLAGGASPRERALLLFSGDSEEELEAARAHWKELKEAGHVLAYYQQDANGRWVEKARDSKAREPGA